MNESTLNYYKNILGLSEECIEVNWYGSETSIEWNEIENCWEIEYNDLGIDFQLIHELGHIFYYKNTNYIYFATKPPMHNNIIFKLWWCHDAVIGSFINYQITRISEIYSLYKNYISTVFTRNINPPELYMWIGGYIEFYLAYNYTLENEEKSELLTPFENFINRAKLVIKQNTFNHINFELIDKTLEKFTHLKSNRIPIIIKEFDFEILDKFSLVKENILETQFNLLYPNL